jgi:hypothetical protein
MWVQCGKFESSVQTTQLKYKGLTKMTATASDALMKQDHTVRLSNVRVLGQSLA